MQEKLEKRPFLNRAFLTEMKQNGIIFPSFAQLSIHSFHIPKYIEIVLSLS